jgi:glycosyltransferase involved in cell wall biosynthesis
MKRKVLLIVYDFGEDSESIRAERAIKQLKKFRWKPIILLLNANEKFCLSSRGESLSVKFKEEYITIINANDKRKINKIIKELSTKTGWKMLNYGHYTLQWTIESIKKGIQIIKKEKIEVIVSRSTPVGTHIIAFFLKIFTNVRWIADLSDPWYGNDYVKSELRIYNWFDKIIEGFFLSFADQIIFVTKYAKRNFQKNHKMINKDKIHVIPNSFDPTEIESIGFKEIGRNKKFTIIYAGNFYGLRSPNTFLIALRNLIEEKNVGKNLLVKFIGADKNIKKIVDELKLDDIVSIEKPKKRSEVYKEISNSNLLLLIDADTKENVFMPLKLAEYLWMRKPILALTPPGEVSDIIKSTGTGIIVPPNDITEIQNAIYRLYCNTTFDKKIYNPVWGEIEKYSTYNCTKKLIRIIEDTVKM